MGGEGEYSLQLLYIQETGISKGKTNQFRYRAWNINGASDFSEISYLMAAQAPDRPPAPQYEASDATSIDLLFSPSNDNGGSFITSYTLQISPYLSTSWTDVATYLGEAMSHTLTQAADGIVPYSEYRFRFYATNDYGDSSSSAELIVSVAPLPSQPPAVTKNQVYSTTTAIMVEWAELTDTEPATGYRLYMTTDSTGEQEMIYDGKNNPNVLSYFIDGLTTGDSYTFNLEAFNFNGAGDLSADATFTACTAPSNLAAPVVSDSTETTLTFTWTAPANNGGCSITGYEIYVDDGSNGAFSSIDSATVADKPYLREHTYTLAATETGKTFRIYLVAENEIDSVQSTLISTVLADVPDAPTTVPTINQALTTANKITIDYAAVTADGGDEVISYEVLMDDGNGGDF